MTPEETAAACKDAVSLIASKFMLDPGTYAAGAEAGFTGLDFYAAGRGGALGDVDADIVAAAFAFFEPGNVRANWEQGTKVLPAKEAAGRFIAAGHAWALANLPADGVDWARLAELVGRVNAAASVAVAPLFAAWRNMPEPEGADPRALALHRLNVARELRFAHHAAAVIAAGIAPLEALAVNSPFMIAVFGWTSEAPEVSDDLRARWEAAEAATNRALASAYGALDDAERDELAALCKAAVAACP
jgi:hypothetical protein